MKAATIAATIIVFTASLACESKKLGVAGATCSASSDCAAELQCVLSTCIDVREAQSKAQSKRDEENKEAMGALTKELQALKDEQARLEEEKRLLDTKLSNVTDEAERQRLLAEKAATDAQIKDNANMQTRHRGPK